MKYKVVISDYDGTYIRDDKSVSFEQLKAVKDFIGRGGYFIICTGRMTSGIDHFLLDDGYEGYLASFNGGEIVDLKTGKTLYKNQLSNQTCIDICKYAEKTGLILQGYPNREFVTTPNNTRADFYRQITGIDNIVVDSLSEYFAKTGLCSTKMLFFDEKEKLDYYFEDLKNTFKDRCNVVRSNDLQIDINAKGVSKGSAVKTIGKLCGVSVNEIICVGDAGNDIPMLEVAGFPIAVANAQDNVKQICKEVVIDNNNDAIKYIIEKYCI